MKVSTVFTLCSSGGGEGRGEGLISSNRLMGMSRLD